MSLADVVAFFQSKQPGNVTTCAGAKGKSLVNQKGNAGNVAVTPSLPKNINKIKAVTPVTPVTQKNNDTKHEIESALPAIEVQPLVNVPEALGRTMDYLIRDDESLPGLCLFSTLDIWEIENGVLPLDNAKRYLEKMEREHLHLIEIRQDPDAHPIESAMDRLVESGLELIKEDRLFIRRLLGSKMFWRVSLGEYKAIWLAAMDAVTQPHKQQNAGRRAANSWLRKSAT